VRLRWQLDADRIARPDAAAGDDDTHDAGFAKQVAVLVAFQGRCHQSRSDAVELGARIAQVGDFDDRRLPETKARAGGQPEQIDPARGDVFPHLTCRNDKPFFRELVVQLGVDQVYLAQVRCFGEVCHSRAMLDRAARMRVTFDSEPDQQLNAVGVGLAQCGWRCG
jgi:hypothetical protein